MGALGALCRFFPFHWNGKENKILVDEYLFNLISLFIF
jgi:hypothetical protein